MKKKTVWLVVALLLCAALAGGYVLLRGQAQAALASLPHANVDMTKLRDGTFEAAADAGVVKVRARVTVSGGRMTAIDLLEHQNGMGEKAEAITDAMVAANAYDVDAVAGATLSSETIRSAVGQALQQSFTP